MPIPLVKLREVTFTFAQLPIIYTAVMSESSPCHPHPPSCSFHPSEMAFWHFKSTKKKKGKTIG